MVEFHLGDLITRSPFGSIAPFSLSPQELKHQMQTRIQFRRTDQGARKTQRKKINLKPKKVSQTPFVQKSVFDIKAPIGSHPRTRINNSIKAPKSLSFKSVPVVFAPSVMTKSVSMSIVLIEYQQLWMNCNQHLCQVEQKNCRLTSAFCANLNFEQFIKTKGRGDVI